MADESLEHTDFINARRTSLENGTWRTQDGPHRNKTSVLDANQIENQVSLLEQGDSVEEHKSQAIGKSPKKLKTSDEVIPKEKRASINTKMQIYQTCNLSSSSQKAKNFNASTQSQH